MTYDSPINHRRYFPASPFIRTKIVILNLFRKLSSSYRSSNPLKKLACCKQVQDDKKKLQSLNPAASFFFILLKLIRYFTDEFDTV